MLGHALFFESIRPFSKLLFTFWSSCWRLWVTYWGIPSFLGIIEPFTGFIIFWASCRSLWVVILGHIPSGRVFLHHYLSYPLALGHLIKSFVLLVWVQFEFLGSHLYRSVIFLSVWAWFFELGTHLYRSVISCQFSLSF